MNQTNFPGLPVPFDESIHVSDPGLKFEVLDLQVQNTKLRKAVAGLESEVAELRAENTRLEARWAALKTYVARLGGPTK